MRPLSKGAISSELGQVESARFNRPFRRGHNHQRKRLCHMRLTLLVLPTIYMIWREWELKEKCGQGKFGELPIYRKSYMVKEGVTTYDSSEENKNQAELFSIQTLDGMHTRRAVDRRMCRAISSAEERTTPPTRTCHASGGPTDPRRQPTFCGTPVDGCEGEVRRSDSGSAQIGRSPL